MKAIEKNKISIIVPIYNVEKYIADGIKAICGQTYKNLEIILVDDGSTDSSGNICDEYAKNDERIRVFHIKNSGQSHARNVGLSYATGNLIGFVDGDDAPASNMYECLYRQMETHQADIVECNFVGRNSPPPDTIDEGAVLLLSGREAIVKQLGMKKPSRYPSTAVWSKLFKKDILENLSFPDGMVHEEYAFLCEAFLRCKNYVYINQILYNRTLRPDSTTKEKFSLRTLDKLRVHRIRNEFLIKQGDQQLLHLSQAQEYNLMIHLYNQTCDNGMIQEAATLEKELYQQKVQIASSGLPWKKKLVFLLFCIHTGFYHEVRGIKSNTENKKRAIISGVVAILFGLFMANGIQLEKNGEIVFFNWTTFAVPFFTLLFGLAIYLLYGKMRSWQGKERKQYKKPPFFVVQGAMILCWIPVLLAAYPGFFCYDASEQLSQAMTGVYTFHHPVAHTYLLGQLLLWTKDRLGSYEIGVLIYCIAQMLLTTAIFSTILNWMMQKKMPKLLVMGSFLYYAFYPTITLFGLCTTKDSLFTPLFLLNMMYLYELLRTHNDTKMKKSKVIKFVVTLVLALLFRNNAIYTWILFLPVLLLVYKNKNKKVLWPIAMGLLLFVIINNGMGVALNAENKSGLKEMLSVPAQQLSRVYHKKGREFFSDKDLERLYSYINQGDLERYSVKLADPAKANLRIGVNTTIIDFARFWIKTGLRAPKEYIDAYLLLTYQAWYPFTIPDGYCGEFAKPKYRDSDTCYFYADVENPLVADSKLPGLLSIYRNFSRHMNFETMPIVSLFFSIGSFAWIFLFLIGYALWCNKKNALAVLLLVFCLCLTCLLGPIVLVRYYLILFYGLPFLIALVCVGEDQKTKSLRELV